MNWEIGKDMEQYASWKAEEDGGVSVEEPEKLSNTAAIEKISRELREGNGYERTMLPDGRLELKNEAGETYYLEALDAEKKKEVHEIQEFMEKVFNPEEIDPEEVTLQELEKQGKPDRRADYMLQMIKDGRGDIVGVMNAAYIPARSERGEGQGFGIGTVAYVMVDKEHQKLGLARELYADFYERTGKAAERRGEEMRYIVGECVSTVEPILNKVGGRSRVYFENGAGHWEEPKDYFPPLEFDPDTGLPAEGAGSGPEHIMVSCVNGNRVIVKEDLLTAMRSIYEYNNVLNTRESIAGIEDMWQLEQLPGSDGERRPLEIIREIYRTLAGQLDGVGKLSLISRAEREEMKSKGIQFDEHRSTDEL